VAALAPESVDVVRLERAVVRDAPAKYVAYHWRRAGSTEPLFANQYRLRSELSQPH